MKRGRFFCLLLSLLLSGDARLAAAPPRVMESLPPDGSAGVDPGLGALRFVFDQEMMGGANYSVCGGGQSFPRLAGPPVWADARTLVVPVSLEPGCQYQLSINSPSRANCRTCKCLWRLFRAGHRSPKQKVHTR